MDEAEFRAWCGAGVALQAYLARRPVDDLQRMVGPWAKSGRRRITVRLVEEACWEYRDRDGAAEGVAVRRCYAGEGPRATGTSKRCAELMLANSSAIIPAIATHNVRTLAAALVAAERHGVAADTFEFQMLFGMAGPVEAALRRMGFVVRDYAPIGELIPGMAYLVRRLLENTSNEGFLRRT